MVTPIVSLAEKALTDFEVKARNQDVGILRIGDRMAMDFGVPEDQYPYLLEWSYSNLLRLWEVGYKAGARFYEKHKDELPHK
jgi:hypothetical protein